MLDLSQSVSRKLSIQSITNGKISCQSNEQTGKIWIPLQKIVSQIFNTSIEEIRLIEVLKGSFNKIFQFQIQSKNYVIRVREKELDFSFEKIAKEPFAILALNNPEHSDQELKKIIDDLLEKKSCRFMANSIIGNVYYSDWSKYSKELPYIFCISEWKKGETLYSVPTSENFKSAGKLLATIHQRTFSSCYPTILDIGTMFYSLQDSILSVVTQQFKKALLVGGSRYLLDEIMKWIEIHTSKLPIKCEAVLCHYDFSGSNIVVDKESSKVSAIDFDNWKVSIREEDFPKLLHWTTIDSVTKKRIPSSEYIQDFLQGYQNEGGVIDERLLRIKEAEWLMRVYAHSLHREQTDPKDYKQSSFPSSNYYEQAIFSLLSAL